MGVVRMYGRLSVRGLFYLAVVGAIFAFACGIAGSAGAQTPRFYRVMQHNGVWWFETPDGKPFFSLGVDCVGPGATRQEYREDRPQYAAFPYYPDTAAWAHTALARLRSWNVNTLGGWCDTETLTKV